jgi:hypothetical protein
MFGSRANPNNTILNLKCYLLCGLFAARLHEKFLMCLLGTLRNFSLRLATKILANKSTF